ncbi:MAG: hypothetical protein V4577_17535 [Bacteroidota bacterium]
MIKIKITPLKGIDIESVGEILLGQTKNDMLKLLGRPSEYHAANSLLYEFYELRIDFDGSGKVEFIEFIYGPFPERTELSLYDINPFNIGADRLIALLSEHNNGEIDDSDGGISYAFLNSSVGVWRQYTQKDVEEGIAQAKLSGQYQHNPSTFDDDLETSRNFWTIGIGVAGYYRL